MNSIMKPERWERVEELFRTAIDHPSGEREAYVTQVCGDDQDLRSEVLSLLARDTSEDFIRGTILSAALSVTAEPADDLTGKRVGPYRVTRLIGRGGMGTVYEAVRDDQHFQQHVALKLIKRGMDTDFVRDRFRRERQILATLDHSCIARLFDGGTTPDGVPYFVMEFVAGEPITEYCRSRRLPLNEKLKLFRQVCSAVQHAHQKLVIHRDLKPSNIMVTPGGTPKLLDFGIGKLLTPESHDSARTVTALRMMTPDYASPEQARGLPVATPTDVYSLGVVFYELLTESRPYEFKTGSPAEIERIICETEPEAPSKLVSRMSGAPARLSRRLAGDLDNIALMAMRKEPERRYQSVEQFSEDIRRHLAGLPVMARKDTFGYRAGKFVRRHKAGVTILSLLLILSVVMTVQAFGIRRERDRANLEAATAQAVTQSLVAMFEVADPGKTKGSAISARDLLDQGTEKVVRDLKNQPAVQAKLMGTIGRLYESIGLYDRAQPLLEEALKLRRQVLGKEHQEVAESLEQLGSLLVNRGSFTEAEPLLKEALAMRRKLLGEDHNDVAESLDSLGRLASEAGKFHDAELLYREALTIRRKLYGASHVLVARDLNNLAAMLQEQGDYTGAETLFREALALRRKLLGEEHPEVAVSLANLASVSQDTGKPEEAERLYRQVLTLRRKLFGQEHPKLATTMNNLATLLLNKGSYEEAGTLFLQALEMRRKELGDDHPEVGTSQFNLGVLLYVKGEYAEAEKLHRQSIETYRKSLKPDHWLIQRSRINLGACLIKLKRYHEAETELVAGYTGLKAALGDRHAQTQKALKRLIELYDSWGKPEKAMPYRALSQANS